MNSIEAIIIAIVEGLTEFLPVSSTGHMIITQNMLGVESTDFVKAFTVIIQFGAILSVVCLYWNRFFRLNPCKIFDAEVVKGITGVAKWKTYGKRFLYKFDFLLEIIGCFFTCSRNRIPFQRCHRFYVGKCLGGSRDACDRGFFHALC